MAADIQPGASAVVTPAKLAATTFGRDRRGSWPLSSSYVGRAEDKVRRLPAREFVPVNNQAIVAHCRGKSQNLLDVMGLYVLTPDCKTWVLVADFDKEGWRRETVLYRDACRAFGLCPAVERSRSGNGRYRG
ncbi:MAG: TOTE conflict system archaeo-eukaryotic primase domain-containing protein [Eggerthellaceae bacterium]